MVRLLFFESPDVKAYEIRWCYTIGGNKENVLQYLRTTNFFVAKVWHNIGPFNPIESSEKHNGSGKLLEWSVPEIDINQNFIWQVRGVFPDGRRTDWSTSIKTKAYQDDIPPQCDDITVEKAVGMIIIKWQYPTAALGDIKYFEIEYLLKKGAWKWFSLEKVTPVILRDNSAVMTTQGFIKKEEKIPYTRFRRPFSFSKRIRIRAVNKKGVHCDWAKSEEYDLNNEVNKELGKLLKRYEKLVERSGKNEKLLNKLIFTRMKLTRKVDKKRWFFKETRQSFRNWRFKGKVNSQRDDLKYEIVETISELVALDRELSSLFGNIHMLSNEQTNFIVGARYEKIPNLLLGNNNLLIRYYEHRDLGAKAQKRPGEMV